MKISGSRTLPAILAVLALGVAGLAFAQADSRPSGTPKPAAAAQAPKVIALVFYADWCPGCKALSPKLKEVMQNPASQQCLFVKLDQTDKESHQAEYLLSALGYGDLWKDHAGKTGHVLLVNPKTKQVVSTLTSEQSTEAMQAALVSAIGGQEHPDHPKSKPDHPEHPKGR